MDPDVRAELKRGWLLSRTNERDGGSQRERERKEREEL
jgi:hypothetical protein